MSDDARERAAEMRRYAAEIRSPGSNAARFWKQGSRNEMADAIEADADALYPETKTVKEGEW